MQSRKYELVLPGYPNPIGGLSFDENIYELPQSLLDQISQAESGSTILSVSIRAQLDPGLIKITPILSEIYRWDWIHYLDLKNDLSKSFLMGIWDFGELRKARLSICNLGVKNNFEILFQESQTAEIKTLLENIGLLGELEK